MNRLTRILGSVSTVNTVERIVFLDPGDTSWTVPDNITTLRIECIGAGGANSVASPMNGGGGGAYAALQSYAVTPGQVLACHVGAGGSETPTWFISPTTLKADCGRNSYQGSTDLPGDGGKAENSVGLIVFRGGNGGPNGSVGGGGGGGAAGPYGIGKSGGSGCTDSGGGGGGCNGSLSTAGVGIGGYGPTGNVGGGASQPGVNGSGGGGGIFPQSGGDGSVFIRWLDRGIGSGGGGGGTSPERTRPGNGGKYGGGGGGASSNDDPVFSKAGDGLIIISYYE